MPVNDYDPSEEEIRRLLEELMNKAKGMVTGNTTDMEWIKLRTEQGNEVRLFGTQFTKACYIERLQQPENNYLLEMLAGLELPTHLAKSMPDAEQNNRWRFFLSGCDSELLKTVLETQNDPDIPAAYLHIHLVYLAEILTTGTQSQDYRCILDEHKIMESIHHLPLCCALELARRDGRFGPVLGPVSPVIPCEKIAMTLFPSIELVEFLSPYIGEHFADRSTDHLARDYWDIYHHKELLPGEWELDVSELDNFEALKKITKLKDSD